MGPNEMEGELQYYDPSSISVSYGVLTVSTSNTKINVCFSSPPTPPCHHHTPLIIVARDTTTSLVG